jgi:hypothetical protein
MPAAAATVTLKVQEALAASVAVDRLTLLLPAVAVMAPPPHDPVNPLGVATVIPAGKVSVNANPVADAEVSVFVTVKLNWLLCPARMVDGENDLPIVGAACTVRFALAAVPAVMLWSDVTVLVVST